MLHPPAPAYRKLNRRKYHQCDLTQNTVGLNLFLVDTFVAWIKKKDLNQTKLSSLHMLSSSNVKKKKIIKPASHLNRGEVKLEVTHRENSQRVFFWGFFRLQNCLLSPPWFHKREALGNIYLCERATRCYNTDLQRRSARLWGQQHLSLRHVVQHTEESCL